MKNVVFIIALFFLMLYCDDDSPTGSSNDPANGYVEVVTPEGGETYTVGSIVTLEFKANGTEVGSVMPQVSVNNGQTWNDIPPQSVFTSGAGGQLLSYNWTIGSEVNPVTYADTNSQCKLKVYDYKYPTRHHISESFTILK